LRQRLSRYPILLGRRTIFTSRELAMTARLRASIPAASVIVACLSGCTPSVNSVSVSPGADVNLVNVQANISDAPAASMGTPVVRVASLADNPPVFRNVPGGFTVNNSPNHSLTGLALPPGQFRIEVQQPYTQVFTSGTQTVSKTQDTIITIPQGCFFFDGSLQSWSTEGFFELRTTSPTDFGTRVDLCTGQLPVVGDSGPNFPQNYTSPIPPPFRSLGMPFNPLINACFGQPTPPPQNGLVVVDLISPDLATVPGWANANGFDVQVRGPNPYLGANPTPVRAQLLLRDNAGTFFRPENPQGQPTFVDLGGAFVPATFVRAGTVLSQIRVRIFFPTAGPVPGNTAAEANIDRVCPKTAS
jgi:hypothetical protein